MSWCPIHVNSQYDPTCSGCQNASPRQKSSFAGPSGSATALPTLILAMKVLARDIESQDGIANAAIAEAAERLQDLKDYDLLLSRIVRKFERSTNMGQLDEIMGQARGFIERKSIGSPLRDESPNEKLTQDARP